MAANHGTPDHGTPDHGTPDHGTPDHGTPDHGTPTNAEPEGRGVSEESVRRAVDLGRVCDELREAVAVVVGYKLEGSAETLEHVIEELEEEVERS